MPADEGCTTNHSTIDARACYDPREKTKTMNWQRSTVVGVTAALLATWLVRTSISLGPPSSPAVTERPVRVSTSSAVVPAVDRLREHLASPIAPITSGRNLFEFRRTDILPPPSQLPPPVPSTVPPSPPVRVAPPLTLIGLAVDEGGDGPVRTAIIQARGDLHLARVGDTVTGLRVATIAEDRVELSGAPDEPRVVLTLK